MCFTMEGDFLPNYDPDEHDVLKQHIILIKGATTRHSNADNVQTVLEDLLTCDVMLSNRIYHDLFCR